MPPSTRIPPLLQPHVQLPPDDCLLLLTSTIGASANWLVTRFLCDALSNLPGDGGGDKGYNVVLVSWMREYEFWRQEARKGAGLDLERLKKEGRLAFVDGLSELCLDAPVANNSAERMPPQATATSTIDGAGSQIRPQTLPVRGPPGRAVPARAPPQVSSAVRSTSMQTSSASRPPPGHHTLKSLDLAHLQTTTASAISSLASSNPTTTSSPQRKTLIILDNPDLLLALNPTLDPSPLTSLILDLHDLPTISHILTHVQSDTPLLSLSTPPQPLELAHHNFLVKLAHMSRRIVGVRVLDTGVARDVSGVLRVTEQRMGWMDLGVEGEEKRKDAERERAREYLYQVKGDGSVRVFERGAGGEG